MSQPDLSAVPPDERQWWRDAPQRPQPTVIDAGPQKVSWLTVLQIILRIWVWTIVTAIMIVVFEVASNGALPGLGAFLIAGGLTLFLVIPRRRRESAS